MIMGKNKERKYLLKSTNKHLLDIFEQNYYVELGSIDLEVMNEFLSGTSIPFNEIADKMILVEGTGRITSDFNYEQEYQLNYLLDFVRWNSSTKLFLTCGIIKYYSTLKQELYAPLLLIPIKLYKNQDGNWEVVKCGEIFENELLMKRLRELTIEPLPKAEDIRRPFDIDHYSQRVAKASGCTFEIGNFLTFARTEYPDLNFIHEELLDTSSFLEYSIAYIYGQALSKTRSLLPSNIYQKYVMVKASQNESFACSGRLNSGKTSTIINIIGERLLKNKQVLYVNSDQVALGELEYRLHELGLGNYTFNLVNPLKTPKISPVRKDYHLRGMKKTLAKLLSNLLSFDHLLDHKYYGYRYREIVENQLSLYINGYVHKPLPIVDKLEKFEVEGIYEKLKAVERALSVIGPYEKCGWSTLEHYYTSSDIKEVVEATTTFEAIQNELYTVFNKFNEQYHFKPTTTIKDAHRLIYILKGFSDNIPPYSWRKIKDFKRATREINYLKELQAEYQKHQTKIQNTYNGDIESVDVEGIFKTLLGPYYEVTDNIYLDRILYNLKSLKELTKRVNINKKVINESLTALKATFKIKVVEDYMYDLLAEINEYLDQHVCQLHWLTQSYDKNPNILDDYNSDYLNYLEYNDLAVRIKSYLKKGAPDDYQTLYSLLTTQDDQKVLQKIINFKLLKEDNLYLFNLIAYLKRYLELVEILTNKMKKHKFKTFDDLANNYHQYKAYIDLLDKSTKEKTFIKKILEDYLTKLEKKRNSAKERLSAFSRTYLDNLDIIKQLKYYNININTPQATKKLTMLYHFVQYFNHIYSLNQKYRPFFKKNNLVIFEDYQELLRDVKNHHRLQKAIAVKDSDYQYLFGEYYRGFKTDIITLERIIAYFQLFLQIIYDPKELDEMLIRDTLLKIISKRKTLEKLYENWYSCYRRFNKLFRDSKSYYFENTLLENMEIISGYVNKLNLLPDVFTVIENIVFIRKYGLDKLALGIENGTFFDNLGDRFLATVYEHYQKAIEDKYPILKDFDKVLTDAKSYCILEKEWFNQNIEYFADKKSNPRDRIKHKLKTISTYSCDRIIDIIGRDYQVYLADVDIFNSNIDLKRFDTIIIDDAHLENSNKYYRLDENLNQVIIFGDKTFTSSVSNNLMQRIIPSAITPLKYRYQSLNNYFDNQLGTNNIYIPRFDQNAKIKRLANISDLTKEIIEASTSKTINIVFASNKTKFKFYRELLNGIDDYEKTKKLLKNINLINALTHDALNADDVYLLFDDFKTMEADVLDKVLTNHNQASQNFYMVYFEDIIEERNQYLEAQMLKLLKRKIAFLPSYNPVISYLVNEFQQQGLGVEWGVGAIDLIVKGAKPYGFIIIGLDEEDKSFIDIYQYYYQEFLKHGWKIEFIYAPALAKDPQAIITKVIKTVMKNG